MCATYLQNVITLYMTVFLRKKYICLSTRKLLTYCCGNRGLAPHLNRIAGVQLGSSRRAGPAPRAHPEPPNALSLDPTLGQNQGMLLF